MTYFRVKMHRSKAKLLTKSAINIMMPLRQSCITNKHATAVSHLSIACSKLKWFFGKRFNSLFVDEKNNFHSWENIYLLISLKYNKRMYWMPTQSKYPPLYSVHDVSNIFVWQIFTYYIVCWRNICFAVRSLLLDFVSKIRCKYCTIAEFEI